MKRKELEANCPDGYTVAIPGQNIDMLDGKELWLIRSNRPEPQKIRIPQDLVDYGNGLGTGVGRTPKEWGYPIYYKLVK